MSSPAPSLGFLGRLGALWSRWRQSRHERTALDGLLSHANPRAPFEARLRWLIALARWVSNPSCPRLAEEAARLPQVTRLRHLLNVLDRNPEWKGRFARTVRSVVRELDALELYSETGLPREPGFWGEAAERLILRLLPHNPDRAELGAVLAEVFPGAEDAAWLEALDDETLARLAAAVVFEEGPEEAGWNALQDDVPDALLYLVSDVRAIGLSTPIRKRLGPVPFRDLPFFGLTRAAEEVVAALGDGGAPAAAARFRELLARCRDTVRLVHAHLDEYGVSVKVVYLMERMQAQLARIERLLDLLSGGAPRPEATVWLFARLVRDNAASRRLSALVRQNLHLLARKVVDRSAETGEHYIARTGEEYRQILEAAAGGGVLTAVTTYGKLAASSLGAAPFVEGLLASVNYAASFVAMQLADLTLATKQPAMTGPALAAKLEGVETPEGVEAFADEVVHLIRSQSATIFGNLAAVVPAVLLVDVAAKLALGRSLLGMEKAHHVVESFSLFGATPVFAALTGVLLWLSSLAAGWADNWFVFRGVGEALGHNRRLRFVLGVTGATRLARFLRENVSGFAGNVSLGVLLGMTPALGRFLGLPLEVRHVTLSAGSLAAAVSALGAGILEHPEFWLAVGGIVSMAVMNLGVSFTLAVFLAARARDLRAPERNAIRRALGRRLVRRPWQFLVPAGPTAASPSPHPH